MKSEGRFNLSHYVLKLLLIRFFVGFLISLSADRFDFHCWFQMLLTQFSWVLQYYYGINLI